MIFVFLEKVFVSRRAECLPIVVTFTFLEKTVVESRMSVNRCDVHISGEDFVLCRFAFQYNPALQPRAIIVFGCISKTVTDSEVKQLLKIMMKVSVMSVSTHLCLEVIHSCTGLSQYNTLGGG